MLIINRDQLCYVKGLGFVRKNKITGYILFFIFSIIWIWFWTTLKFEPKPIQESLIKSVYHKVIPKISLQDKMVKYMQNINPDLDKKVAYKLADTIIDNENEYGLPIKLQLGLIDVESKFKQYALSKTGALGFWQIIPSWHTDKVYAMLDSGEIDTKNLYDAQTNSKLGAKILSDCLKKYNGNIKRGLQCFNGTQNDIDMTYSSLVLKAKNKANQIKI